MASAMEREFEARFEPGRRDSKMPVSTPIKQEQEMPRKQSPETTFDGWSSPANNWSTPPPAPASSPPIAQYTPHQLRKIGEQCGNRLPPASAVQSMFLYEMQRQTELESLFHGSIFQLAKQEDDTTAQNKRIQDLEDRLARFEKQTASRDLQERLATSKTAMSVQQHRLDHCLGRVATLEGKLVSLTDDIDTKKAAQESTAAEDTTTSSAEINRDIEVIKEEVNVLFGDRDGIIEMVDDIKTRLSKLEDNVRMLTLQNTAIRSPTPTQSIDLQTPNTNGLALGVPKGKPAVSLNKENRHVAAIRSFTPGKQWAA
ncbi:Hypothetical predicted protein [Lecanosticta acicola]|uniref:Uncharacterized protein n=1 Tax=Lecanosticta acicola TaxID=111012 RepID=A0AAI9E858_9PEZI|nr:Hypothetical predicted protein [Lecanosticta acicola]